MVPRKGLELDLYHDVPNRLSHGSVEMSFLSLGLLSTEHRSDSLDQGESYGVPHALLEYQTGAVIQSLSHPR